VAFPSTPEPVPAQAAARPTETAAAAEPMPRADEAEPAPSTVPPPAVPADTLAAAPPAATVILPRAPEPEATTPETVTPPAPLELVARVVPEPGPREDRREAEPVADTAEAEGGVAEPPPPIADAAPRRPATAAVAGASFEERIGTRWTVWVGGLA